MKRAMVLVLSILVLLLTACSATESQRSVAADPPVMTAPVREPGPEDASFHASPPEPAPSPADAGTQTEVTVIAPRTAPLGSDGPLAAPVAAHPKPAIRWYPRSIGMPVVSDDPAAKGKKVVVLTFDDGPSDSGTTAQILDVLAEQHVRAMFFITGAGVRHRELVERIHREGHVLGPHSMTHANLTKLRESEQRKEIEPLIQLIEAVTGKRPKYFRPPFGAYNDQLLALVKEYGMEVLNWTDGSLDWEGTKNGYKDPKLVVADVMRQLHPGAVILMHDTLKHTAEALPELIRRIRAEGYEFVVLE